MKHSAYPKYKKSGVGWLGNVPEHWEVKRLKNSADYCVSNVDKVPSEDEIPVRLCNYTDVYYNDFISSDMELMETTATQEEIEKFHLRKEDVIITKDSEEWDDIAISALVTKTTPDLVCGYHLAIIRPKKGKLFGRYLLRQFQCSQVNHQFQIAATGVTRYGLPKSAIGEALIPLPPFPEQQAIAAFLDHETGRVDSLIGKKQKLIELLKEKRTALISRAVTKGLSPKVKMKPSGVEWLGDVPEHWAVKCLKYLVRMKSGEGITSEEIQESDEYPVYGGNGLRGYFSDFTHDGHYVLIGRQGALCGNINYGKGKFWASEHAVVADPITPISTLWLGELLRIMNLNQYSISAAQPGLAIDKIKELIIPLPPFTEQQAIAEFLDRETSKIDTLAAKVEAAIEKLKEYRIALISAAVTGKIDVREVE